MPQSGQVRLQRTGVRPNKRQLKTYVRCTALGRSTPVPSATWWHDLTLLPLPQRKLALSTSTANPGHPTYGLSFKMRPSCNWTRALCVLNLDRELAEQVNRAADAGA